MRLNEVSSALPAARFNACLDALKEAGGFALAVSGGPDSLAMLLLFASWRRQRNDARPAIVFTVDHGLRPESGQEAQGVAAICEELGLRHRTLEWKHDGVTSGLQEKARAARYELMGEACRTAGLSHLLLAHTLDDQAETVVMRLIRGSGVDGLAAMRPLRPLRQMPEMPLVLVRPLLGERKSRLTDGLAQLDVAFIRDPSNRNADFQRVRVRQLLEGLEREVGPVSERLAATAARMARVSQALEWSVTGFIASHLGTSEAGDITFAVDAFRQLPQELRLRLFRRILALNGHGGVPEEEQLLRLDDSLALNGVMTLGGWQFSAGDKTFYACRELGRFPAEPCGIAGRGAFLWDGRFQVEAGGTPGRPGQGADGLRLEAVGERWVEVKALYALEGTSGLAPLARQALPCIAAAGQIVAVPYFGACEGVRVRSAIRLRLLEKTGRPMKRRWNGARRTGMSRKP